MVHGYTAVPVLNDQEQYIGSVRAIQAFTKELTALAEKMDKD